MLTVTFNPSLDTTAVARSVESGRKIRCSEVRHDAGGGGVNVARAATELGADATAVWTKGGPFADMVADRLSEEGVADHAVAIRGSTRQSFAVIEEGESRRHFRFSTPGPDMSREEIDAVVAEIVRRAPDLLVLSGGLPPGAPVDTYAAIASKATAWGARVLLDAHGAELESALERGHLFAVKPNLREWSSVTGGEAEVSGAVERAREFVDSGATRAIFLSLGGDGAVLVASEMTVRATPPSVDVVSKIGAGDSMVAGIAARIASGGGLEDALAFGVAAGTAAVTTPGTRLCTRSTTEQIAPEVTITAV